MSDPRQACRRHGGSSRGRARRPRGRRAGVGSARTRPVCGGRQLWNRLRSGEETLTVILDCAAVNVCGCACVCGGGSMVVGGGQKKEGRSLEGLVRSREPKNKQNVLRRLRRTTRFASDRTDLAVILQGAQMTQKRCRYSIRHTCGVEQKEREGRGRLDVGHQQTRIIASEKRVDLLGESWADLARVRYPVGAEPALRDAQSTHEKRCQCMRTSWSTQAVFKVDLRPAPQASSAPSCASPRVVGRPIRVRRRSP